MGALYRYFVTDPRGLRLEEVAEGLKQDAPKLTVHDFVQGPSPTFRISERGELVATVEWLGKTNPRYRTELDQYLPVLGSSGVRGRDALLSQVSRARCVLAIDVVHGVEGHGTSADPLRGLWRWLLDYRSGVLDVDESGISPGLGEIDTEDDER